MALTVISGVVTNTLSPGSDDTVLVAQDAVLSAEGTHAIQTASDDVRINVLGTVANASTNLAPIGVGILNVQSDRASVFVGRSGNVIGTSQAIFVNDGVDNSIINQGELQGRSNVIRSEGGEIDIFNGGFITRTGHDGLDSAVFISSGNGGLNSDNIRNVFNSGVISAPGLGYSTTGPAAVSNFSGTLFSLENTGEILVGNGTAVYSSANFSQIYNGGTIVGSIVLRQMGEIRNTGLIEGDIRLEYGPTVTNDVYFATGHGLVTGEMTMGSGDDRAVLGDLGGSVQGQTGQDTLVGGAGSDTLFGGDGNDTLSGRSGEDELMGGSGADRILGGEGNDLILGQDDGDRLFGNGGDDEILGGDGNDTVQAGAGDDMVSGENGTDWMAGNAGDDTLDGGMGSDTLQGNAGEDALTGGLSRDVLTGGSGADVFIFEGISDSGHGTSSDRIVDFTDGDLLDLTAVSTQEMEFAGTDPHNGGGIASVRYFTNHLGSSAILVDADGDGVSDMRIVLLNATGFTGGDFLL